MPSIMAAAAGAAALYEEQAVLAYPPDRPTTGREAIRAVYQQIVDAGARFGTETPLPTVTFEELALTSTARPTTLACGSRCCDASPTAPGCGSSTVRRWMRS
ncbi:MAG: hypothetical protein ACRDPH_02660 [Marmoricola sp.]